MRIVILAVGVVLGLLLAVFDAKTTHKFLEFVEAPRGQGVRGTNGDSPILVVGGSITMRGYKWTTSGSPITDAVSASKKQMRWVQISGAYDNHGQPLPKSQLQTNWKVTLTTAKYRHSIDQPGSRTQFGTVEISPGPEFIGVTVHSSVQLFAHRKDSGTSGTGVKFFDPACDPATDDCDQILDTISVDLGDGKSLSYDCDGGQCLVTLSEN